jgi:DNA-binding NarL/FixJ family response regulator
VRSSDATRVVVAAANSYMCDGIARALIDDDRMTVVGTAETCQRLVRIAAERRADVAVCDAGLVSADDPSLPVPTVLLSDECAATFRRLFHCGAVGVVSTDTDGSRLRAAVEHAAHGGVVLTQDQLAAVAQAARRRVVLTNREREIHRLRRQGLTNRQIADQLCLAEGTVKNSVSAVYKKLGQTKRRAGGAEFAGNVDEA